MKHIFHLATNVLALCTLSCQGDPASSPSEASLSGDRISAHVKFLSGDALGGRGPATPGETLTTEYIATQFALAGLKPAGDDGSYFQKVPLVGVQSLPETDLSWQGGGKKLRMNWLEDYVAVNHRQQASQTIDAEAIYVGHGIVAPEFDWDDYKGVDVKGKVVVLFTNEPQSQDPAFFGGKALTYYGRWVFKYEEALRQGAAGAIIIHTLPTAGYPWTVVRNSWGGRNPYVKLAEGEPALGVAGWVTSPTGERILTQTGKSLDELLKEADSPDFQPVPLKLGLRGRISSRVQPFDTRNVIGIVEGSDPRKNDEAVLYSAHWDHLGEGIAVDGDSIYNGAVDNATGCGILLELARAFSELEQPPARSILFAAVGAEEGGLRGSKYYSEHPVVPVGKTAVNLNYDGLMPLGLSTDISLPGYERTTLRQTVERLAEKFQLEIRPEAHPEQGYYYRSDHFSLAKAGVPAFSIKSGTQYQGRPEDWGAQAREQYTANDYHQPSDEFDPSWDFSGLEQIARFGFAIGREVANQPELPTWNPGDEFLAAREKSWAR
jgi:Zn-dependent M28 family amino/carboxypeptidase